MFGLVRLFTIAGFLFAAASCSANNAPVGADNADSTPEESDAPQILTGNGERNFILLEGAARSGATFTFTAVGIERNGWLVMHPFRDGAPVQTEYVGATPVPAGVSRDVKITIDGPPATGEMFVVMLHNDMNDDGAFDFNDGLTVPDAPVFEDGKLIALRYAAPEETPAVASEKFALTSDEVRASHLTQATLVQLYRWYTFYENDAASLDNQLNVLADDIRLKSSLGESVGHDGYRARVAELPAEWDNAHFVRHAAVTVGEDGALNLAAAIIYLNRGRDPDGKVIGAELSYDTEMTPTDGMLPRFSSIDIQATGEGAPDVFISSYAENRIKALVHYWLTIVEHPSRDAEPAREILADGFALNFSSGALTSFDDVSAWLKGPASAVTASSHTMRNFSYRQLDGGLWRATFEFEWQGLLPDGKGMIAETRHKWDVVDEPSDRFAKIKNVDVEVLTPFQVSE